MLKIDEYRRRARKLKNAATSRAADAMVVDDVYWKGIAYYDVCRVDRELKELSDKAKIKADIQSRKDRLKEQLTTKGLSGLPPTASNSRLLKNGRSTPGISSYENSNTKGGTVVQKAIMMTSRSNAIGLNSARNSESGQNAKYRSQNSRPNWMSEAWIRWGRGRWNEYNN